MAWKIQAICGPVLTAREVHVQNSERNRQPFAPLDDTQKIGVLQIVIGLIVATVSTLPRQDLC